MKRKLSLVSTFALGALLFLTGASTAVAAPITLESVAQPDSQVTAASWTPWDGNHITSATNCAARLSFIAKTYGIQRSALWCEMFAEPICPPKYFWVLMVNTSAAAFSVPVEPALEAASPTLVAACASA